MKIILAPDSFKGTLEAEQICRIESREIKKLCPDAEIICIPMADGGEGITNAYLSILGGEKRWVNVKDPIKGFLFNGIPAEDDKGRRIEGYHKAYYGILPDGTAIMEMAQAAGLPFAGEKKDPLHADSYGVGEMLLDAKKHGVNKVLLGIGGSATNDCGIGMAAALGYKFLDDRGNEIEPLALNLGKISEIIPPEEPLSLNISAACDVTNPLLGPDGATRTFGPQKGATPEMIEILESGMTSYADVLEKFCGKEIKNVPGSGAAGGLGAMLLGMLNARLLPGAEMLLDAAGFDAELENADLVITGEGRIDWQSAYGKVPGTIAAHCAKANVPCIAICGSRGKDAESLLGKGITAIHTTGEHRENFEEIAKYAEEDLESKAREVFSKLLKE